MSSSTPLRTPTGHPGGQYSPSALSEKRPCTPLPAQTEVRIQVDAEPSVMAASAVAANKSSATTTPSAIEKADLEPWRYRGYPKFCKWAASDDDFFVLRIFGSTSARLALYLQDQIAYQEQALKDADAKAEQDCRDSGSFRSDRQEERVQIMNKLLLLTERYHKFLFYLMESRSRPKATAFQLGNVRQWLANANHPIRKEEVAYLNEENDLIAMTSTSQAPLRQLLDRFPFLNFLRHAPCFRERKKNERLYGEEGDFELETTVYSNDRFFEKIVAVLTIVIGLAMLIGPLWLLQHPVTELSNPEFHSRVVTGFTVLFTILASLFTVAKPYQILEATAAYAVILMVFASTTVL